MTFDISPSVVAVISLGINSIVGILMAWIALKNAQLRTDIKEQGNVLKQVEQQGNSVALELKRTNMVYSRRLADETKKPADIAIANDAQKVYEAAEQSIIHKNYPVS